MISLVCRIWAWSTEPGASPLSSVKRDDPGVQYGNSAAYEYVGRARTVAVTHMEKWLTFGDTLASGKGLAP
jgi:hypothetical protein